MLVRDIMTRSVKVARPDSRIQDVALVMCFNKISGMPVVDADNHILGIISEKDVLWAMFPDLQDVMNQPATLNFEDMERDYRDVINMRVEQLMTRNVITVQPDLPLLRAASAMFRNRIRRVPVAEQGKLAGVISVGDVHKAIFQANMATDQPMAEFLSSVR